MEKDLKFVRHVTIQIKSRGAFGNLQLLPANSKQSLLIEGVVRRLITILSTFQVSRAAPMFQNFSYWRAFSAGSKFSDLVSIRGPLT